MIQLVPGAVLFVLFVFLFIQEVKLDHKRYAEQDRLGDEHIMREINEFLRKQDSLRCYPLQNSDNAEEFI